MSAEAIEPQAIKPARGFLRTVWRLGAIAFALIAILLALIIGLFRVLVPMVPDFHARIEGAASGALGMPVQFERLDVRWRFKGPELVFYGATVYDTERNVTLLEARDGHVNLNVGAFIVNRAVVPDSVVLRGLNIEIHRDAQGRFSVLGRAARSGESLPRPRSANWPLPDGRYVLRESQVRYTRADGPPVVVPSVDLNIDVDGQRLRLDGSIVPPEGMGNALDLSAELDGGMAAAQALQWQVYVAGSRLFVASLNDLLGAYALPFASGRADIVAWASFTGTSMNNASLDLSVADLGLQSDSDALYQQIKGRFEWDRTPLGWRAEAHDLFMDRGGRSWPLVDASVSLDEGPGGEQRWQATLPFLRLDDVAPLVSALPAHPVVAAVRAHQPRGDLKDVDVIVRRERDSEPQIALSGRFEKLGWAGANRVPGVRGLSGRIRSDELGGALNVESDALAVDAPTLFEQTLEAWRLTGSVSWREQDDGWRIISDNVLLATQDFDALAQFELFTHANDQSPDLTLKADVGDLDIARALNYLPVRVMKPKLVNWLTAALQAGTARSATVNIDGPLDQFPYADAGTSGVFNAVVDVEDLSMVFGRGWPVTTGIDSIVRFDKRALSAAVSAAQFGAARANSGQVEIDDLTDAVLEVTVTTDAPLEDVREYFVTTPSARRYEALLAELVPSGAARTSLSLSMPLKTPRDLDYQVDIVPQGAQLNYRDWPIALEDIRGNVTLSRDGLFSKAATGVLLGRPVAVAVETVPTLDGDTPARAVRVRGSGRTDANVLAERLHPPLADFFRGAADWQADIAFPPLNSATSRPTLITLTSPLDDLAIRLPAPLAKDVGSSRALTAQLAVERDREMILDLTLGEDLAAVFALATDEPKPRIVRGAISLNDGPPILGPRDGVAISGTLAELNCSDWLNLSSERDGEGGVIDLLRTADVKLGQFQIFGQTVNEARVTLDRNVREWLIEVDSADVNGAIFLPFDFRTSGGPVIANMQTLTWLTGEEDSAGVDPRQLPSLRLDAESFRFDDMRFGALSTEIRQVEDGLQIERMTSEAPGFSGTASGTWRYAGGAPSQFSMEIVSTDVKTTLEALGSVGAIDSGEARFTMDINWDDELDSGFIRDHYGKVTVAVGDGQLLNVDPKAGRVFGLISLTALPRRLSLDFRDIFNKGFAFDAIEGEFSLRDGNAFTDNLTLRGPAAQVAVVGRAGIADRDYDQTASVFANFGSSLPIAGAIAGGPAVGAALLIFTELFKDPLKQISRVDYGISGSWTDPQVARLGADGRPSAEPRSEPAAPVEPQETAVTEGASD
ncbi:MAG: YhdP family protein [Gammaproteobacteria bacterium]